MRLKKDWTHLAAGTTVYDYDYTQLENNNIGAACRQIWHNYQSHSTAKKLPEPELAFIFLQSSSVAHIGILDYVVIICTICSTILNILPLV